jgi:hypothetical protein
MKALLYSRADAARILSISLRKLDCLLKEKAVSVVKIGKRTLIAQDELERFALCGKLLKRRPNGALLPPTKKYFGIHGKSVPVTADTVNALELGYELGFQEALNRPDRDVTTDEVYMAMMRNDWLMAEGVSQKLRGN